MPCRFPQAQLTNQFQITMVSWKRKKTLNRYFTNSETQFSRNVVLYVQVSFLPFLTPLSFEQTDPLPQGIFPAPD